MLLANILQASIAIRSPPAPYPPVSSPSKSLSPSRQPTATTNWRGLGSKSCGLSPNVRPPFPSRHNSQLTWDNTRRARVSRRRPSASCPSPAQPPWAAGRIRVQAAGRTRGASRSPTRSRSPTSLRPRRLPHRLLPPRMTARSARFRPLRHQLRHLRRTAGVGRPQDVRPHLLFSSCPYFFELRC